MSSNLKRGHNLPDINLEILEVLITECKNKFDTTKYKCLGYGKLV